MALVVAHFGELDEVLGVFGGVEGELAELDVRELLVGVHGELAGLVAAGLGVIYPLHIFYYEGELRLIGPF